MAKAALIGAVAMVTVAAAPVSPPAGVDTTVPLTSIPGHDALVTEALFSAGQQIGAHRHPGLEVAYLIDGEMLFQMENERERTLRPGDSLTIPAGAYHRARAGSTGAKLLIFRVHPSGQPLRIAPDRPVRFPE